MRKEKREKGELRAFSQDLRSSVGRFSSSQEQKFIASTRGTCGYLERRISPKIQEGRFREIEVVGFRRLPTHVSTLKEVRIVLTLAYFPSLGREKRVFRLRACSAKKN